MSDLSPASLPAFVIRRRQLIPIAQEGMGVGISAHRLAVNVMRDFERVIPECREFFHAQGIADDAIPLIAAGCINSNERVIELQALGAAGVHANSLGGAGWDGWWVAGGLFYTGGMVFHLHDEQWRHAHGIWHLFVLAGSASHSFTILLFVA